MARVGPHHDGEKIDVEKVVNPPLTTHYTEIHPSVRFNVRFCLMHANPP